MALALVGCNTNDTENKLNGKLPSINKVTSESTTLVEECEVGYTIDFVNRTIQLTFNDFKTPGTSKVSLQTPELPFTITENGYSVSSTGAINPIVDGVQSPYYTMNNFNCNINVYSDGTYAADDYAFSFDIATPDGVTYGVRRTGFSSGTHRLLSTATAKAYTTTPMAFTASSSISRT